MMLMGLRYVRHEVMRANDPAPDIYRISIVVHLMSVSYTHLTLPTKA